MFDDLAKDIRRYLPRGRKEEAISPLRACWMMARQPALWAISNYRFGRWVHTRCPRPARILLRVPYSLWRWLVSPPTGIHIPWDADIGPGLYIGHYGGIWIGPVRIGERCNIAHGVTIGRGGRGRRSGYPTIGDRVWIGPGAVLFGKIRIGNDVAVAANSVVFVNVPDGATYAGNPGQVVCAFGSRDLIN